MRRRKITIGIDGIDCQIKANSRTLQCHLTIQFGVIQNNREIIQLGAIALIGQIKPGTHAGQHIGVSRFWHGHVLRSQPVAQIELRQTEAAGKQRLGIDGFACQIAGQLQIARGQFQITHGDSIATQRGGDCSCQLSLNLTVRQILALRICRQLETADIDDAFTLIDIDGATHLDLGIQLRCLAFQLEIHIQSHRITGGDRATLEIERSDFKILASAAVIPADLGVIDIDTTNRQTGQRCRTCVFIRLPYFIRLLTTFGKIIPVGGSILQLGQIQGQAVQRNGIHLQLTAQQWHQFDMHGSPLDGRKILTIKTSSIAQLHSADINTQPGENREFQIAINGQGATCLLLHFGNDLILVIVRVDHHRQNHNGRHHKQHQYANQYADDFEQFAHQSLPVC